MKRRSFKPVPEGMEPREMLTRGATAALLGAPDIAPRSANGALQVPGGPLSGSVQIPVQAQTAAETMAPRRAPAPKASAPNTPTQKQQIQRIERLPYFLQQIDPNRALPPDTVKQIQDDLLSLKNTLTRAPSAALSAFNDVVKDTLAVPSIRQDNAVRLDVTFGSVLTDAGGDPAVVDSLRAGLQQLTQFSSEQPVASQIVANDYSTVLQVALGIGRPTPTKPTPTSRALPTGPRALSFI